MHLEIVTVGTLRQPYIKEGVQDYLRRLRRYTPVTLTVVKEASLPPAAAAAAVEEAKAKEAQAILARLPANAFAVALDEGGKMFTSPELAAWLEELASRGIGRVAFIVGGPRGLAPAVLARAEASLSLSRLTFTHELACLLLLEQLYRSFKINRGEPYHY